jgi:Holliday junction resolvase
MNTAAKGTRTEKEFADMMETNGFHVMFRSLRVKFQMIDLDNMFDIMACTSSKEKIYVSVKSAYSFSKVKHLAQLNKWANANANTCELVWLAIKHPKPWTREQPQFDWIPSDRWEVIQVRGVVGW